MLCKGIVLDHNRVPVEGALVYVSWGTADFREIAIETNREGIFFLSLPEGRFRVEAVGQSGACGQAEVEQKGDDSAGLIEIRLEEGPAEHG